MIETLKLVFLLIGVVASLYAVCKFIWILFQDGFNTLLKRRIGHWDNGALNNMDRRLFYTEAQLDCIADRVRALENKLSEVQSQLYAAPVNNA